MNVWVYVLSRKLQLLSCANENKIVKSSKLFTWESHACEEASAEVLCIYLSCVWFDLKDLNYVQPMTQEASAMCDQV